jgi:uncharacterized protein YybS (DUF2232 family)
VRKTNLVAEGAVLAALYAVLLLITLYVPLTSIITLWVLSIPFTMFTVRNGLKPSYLFLSVAFALTLIIGGLYALPITLLYGSVGVVLGVLYQKKKPVFGILLGGSLTYLINIVLIYVMSILFFNLNPADMVNDTLRQSITLTEEMSKLFGQDVSEQIEQLEQLIEIIVYIIPTAIVMGSVLLAFITQLITSALLRRFRIDVPKWKPFRDWSFPKSFVWYYLAVIVLLMTDPEKGSALFVAGWNLFYLLEFILVIQGLSVIFYFFWKKNKSKAIPIVIVIFTFIIPVFLYVVRILGIIDLGFDLRKRIKT